MNYKNRLTNMELKLSQLKKEAIEDIKAYLKRKGNISELLSIETQHRQRALYYDKNDDACWATINHIEVEHDRLYVTLSTGHIFYEEDITLDLIQQIITIIQNEHGTYSK